MSRAGVKRRPLPGPDVPSKLRGPSRAGRSAPAGAPTAPARGERPAVIADAVKIVAWLSLAAGAIHAIAMIDHFSHWWLYGLFFLVLTYGQVLWGIDLLRKPATDRNLQLAAYANLAICAVWLYSRTIGVPIGPDAGNPEPIGVMDVCATLDQVALAVYVGLVVRPQLRVVRGLRTLLGVHRVRLGMMLCSATVFAGLLGGHHH